MSDQHVEFEELEHIPWSALATRTTDPWSKVAYIVGGSIAAIMIGLFAARWLTSGEGATVVTLPSAPPASPVVVTTTTAIPAVSSTPAAAAAVPASAVYSEADLMAISVDDESRLAAMRAEWFVQDYFTVDGGERAVDDLAEVLGADLPVPHQDPAGYSYVEWARAFAVTNLSPGRYAIDVAYRTLVPTEATGFARTDVRAVKLTFDVDVDGTTRLVDLPTPVSPPLALPMAVVAGEQVAAPDEMTVDVLQATAAMGFDPVVLEVTRDGDDWRFVMQIGNESGNRWPMVVVRQSP